MLIDLATQLRHRIAESVDLIEKEHSDQVIDAVLDAARELLSASKAEVWQVGKPVRVYSKDNVLSRVACSPRKKGSRDCAYGRNPIYEVKNPEINRGVWTYVYDTNRPIWVINANQDFSKVPKSKVFEEDLASLSHKTAGVPAEQIVYCRPLKNEIPSTPERLLDSFYNFVDKDSKTVITIPFTKKIEEGDACWGILDLEFDREVGYEKEQFDALEKLTDEISSIRWKTKAWERTKEDTADVVNTFAGWCKNLSTQVRSATLPYKTGLLIKHTRSEQKLYNDLLAWFAAKRVQIDEYIIERQTAKLEATKHMEIREIIEKEHFGIVDLSHHEQVLDLPFILGLFAMGRRPCLALYSTAPQEEFPPIVELIARQAIESVSGEKLLHVYKYKMVDNEVVFSQDGITFEDKTTRLETFLQSVSRQSEAFRNACGYGPGM